MRKQSSTSRPLAVVRLLSSPLAVVRLLSRPLAVVRLLSRSILSPFASRLRLRLSNFASRLRLRLSHFASLSYFSFASLFAFASLSASAAIPVTWSVDTFRVKPLIYDCYHGETLDLAASLSAYGTPLDLSGKTARLYWQTNGMAHTYWSTNATIKAALSSSPIPTQTLNNSNTQILNITNILAATFSGAFDPGADTVSGFIGVDGENYRASFVLRFLPSPGFAPAHLPLPTPVIDFATTRVANPDASPFLVKGGSGGIDPATATNITDHILASSNLVNVATLAAATNAVALTLGSEIAARPTTNAVDAILAASNLCTVAAAQAMTNDATIVRGEYDSTIGYVTRVAYCYLADEASLANQALNLNEGYWTDGEHPTTLSGYGITDAYTKTESDDKFLTKDWANDETSQFAGEAAYAQTAVSATTSTSSSKIKSLSETWSTEYETYTGAGNTYLRLKDSYWGWYAFLSDIPSTNGLVPRLTGVTYDFGHGSNFTLRLYATLTNLIDRFGGAITNAPAFN